MRCLPLPKLRTGSDSIQTVVPRLGAEHLRARLVRLGRGARRSAAHFGTAGAVSAGRPVACLVGACLLGASLLIASLLSAGTLGATSDLGASALPGSPPNRAGAIPRFDGARAQVWIERQCALGPRVPGSTAHAKCLLMMTTYLDSVRVPYRRHPFRVQSPLGGGEIGCTNLIASIRPGARPRLLLGSHWDSRPWADEDPDPKSWAKPTPGANDGASSTAVLLELARILAQAPPAIGIDLVFFDAEDLGAKDRPEDFCLGSQRLAREWSGPLPDWVLILDMVGARGASFQPELYSRELHPDWVDLLFQTALTRGYSEFVASGGNYIVDDHVPWLRRGIPATDLIGWGDPSWHTLSDTPARTSPTTLAKVGTVVLDLIYGGILGGP